MHRSLSIAFLFITLAGISTHRCVGTEYRYIGPLNGEWNDPANWSSLNPGEYPQAYEDFALIDSDPSRDVTVSISQNIPWLGSLDIDYGD